MKELENLQDESKQNKPVLEKDKGDFVTKEQVEDIFLQFLKAKDYQPQRNIEFLRHVIQIAVNGVDITRFKYLGASEIRGGQDMDTPNTNSNYFPNNDDFGHKWINANNYPIMFDIIIPEGKKGIASIKLIIKTPAGGNINFSARNYHATNSKGDETSSLKTGVINVGAGYQQLQLPVSDYSSLDLDAKSAVNCYIERNAIGADTIAGDIYVMGAIIEFS